MKSQVSGLIFFSLSYWKKKRQALLSKQADRKNDRIGVEINETEHRKQ